MLLSPLVMADVLWVLLKIFQSLKGGDLKVSAVKNRDRHSHEGTTKTADMNCLMNIQYVEKVGKDKGTDI